MVQLYCCRLGRPIRQKNEIVLAPSSGFLQTVSSINIAINSGVAFELAKKCMNFKLIFSSLSNTVVNNYYDYVLLF